MFTPSFVLFEILFRIYRLLGIFTLLINDPVIATQREKLNNCLKLFIIIDLDSPENCASVLE